MIKEVISPFRIVLSNYDVILFTTVMHPHLKTLVNQKEAKWNTASYLVRIDSFARWESKKSLRKYMWSLGDNIGLINLHNTLFRMLKAAKGIAMQY